MVVGGGADAAAVGSTDGRGGLLPATLGRADAIHRRTAGPDR